MFNKQYILLCIFLITSCAINDNMQNTNTVESNNQRFFQFSYEVDIEPTEGKKLELWIPVPQSNEVQTISNLEYDCSGLKHELKTESIHNNKYLYIYSENGISEIKNVKLSCNVLRKEHQNVEYENIDNKRYLKASRMVPTGSVFKNIISDNNLNNQDMKGVYNFVLNGMHYGKPTDNKSSKNYKYIHGGKNPKTGEEWLSNDITYGLKKKTKDELVKSQNKNEKYAYGNGNSLYACDIGVGNCTDYHSYFISLSRTLDVPARFHMGFPIPNGEEGKVGGYHCWADYYVDGEGWYPVDISEADKDPGRAEYFFGTICKNRVDFMVGRDFKIDNYEEESVNLFIYPLLEVDDQVSKGYTKRFSYKNL